MTTKPTSNPQLQWHGVASDRDAPIAVHFATPKSFLAKSIADVPTPAGVLVLKSFLVDPSSAGADVRLSMCRLEEEISAGDLAELDTLARGARVMGRREGEERPAFESQLVSGETRAGRKWFCRSKLIKDGNFAYRLDAAAPSSSSDATAALCANIAMSLRLAGKPSGQLSEPLGSLRLPKSPFALEYPASWHVTHVDAESAVASVVIAKAMAVRKEQVFVDVYDLEGFSVTECFRQCVAKLADQGLSVGGSAVIAETASPPFTSVYVCCPRVADGAVELASGVAVMLTETHAVRLASVGVGREELAIWAMTKRCLEIIKTSLTVVPA